jgi:hypothetical protein
MADLDVLEGFICPICMTDFKTPTLLTKHFEEYHKDDPEILRSLKGFLISFLFHNNGLCSLTNLQFIFSSSRQLIYKHHY